MLSVLAASYNAVVALVTFPLALVIDLFATFCAAIATCGLVRDVFSMFCICASIVGFISDWRVAMKSSKLGVEDQKKIQIKITLRD